jgi:hypothetical protein
VWRSGSRPTRGLSVASPLLALPPLPSSRHLPTTYNNREAALHRDASVSGLLSSFVAVRHNRLAARPRSAGA